MTVKIGDVGWRRHFSRASLRLPSLAPGSRIVCLGVAPHAASFPPRFLFDGLVTAVEARHRVAVSNQPFPNVFASIADRPQHPAVLVVALDGNAHSLAADRFAKRSFDSLAMVEPESPPVFRNLIPLRRIEAGQADRVSRHPDPVTVRDVRPSFDRVPRPLLLDAPLEKKQQRNRQNDKGNQFHAPANLSVPAVSVAPLRPLLPGRVKAREEAIYAGLHEPDEPLALSPTVSARTLHPYHVIMNTEREPDDRILFQLFNSVGVVLKPRNSTVMPDYRRVHVDDALHH